MKYDVNSFSYGVELEYGNCDRFAQLPDGASWNNKDNTCVSSTGIANDPDGVLYKFGGEINTRPTMTIDEQIEHITKINNSLLNPKAIVNYRSNLHIHVRVPGLKDDLESCKKLLMYVDRYQQQAFDIVETIPVPNPKFLEPEVYEWAVKRMKRRKRSHQHKIPRARYDAMLFSKTTQEFYENHAHKNPKGEPAWFQCPRAGINLRQMWEETNTIEFRHFPGTMDMVEMESALRWSQQFLHAALNLDDVSPAEWSASQKWKFPDFRPYEYETEMVYQWTNFDTNKKSDIKKRLTALREHVNIDDIENVKSKDVFQVMLQLQKEEGL